MPPSSSAQDLLDLGKRQYKAGQWSDARRSLDKALSLGNRQAEIYELKAKAYLRQSIAEAKEYTRTSSGPDGAASYEAAYATAVSAVSKFTKDRWQPYYIIADIVYHRQKYMCAQSYITKAENHPSFRRANADQKALIRKFAERIQHDRRYINVRNRGRAEVEAIEKDLEREAQVRKRTNYEHVLPDDILLRIVEVARDSDPRLPVRMSGVSPRWRQALLNQRGVWQRLILGKGKDVVFKVKTYLERCGGEDGAEGSGLRELRITLGFDWNKADEIGKLLKDHARYIERLRLDIRPNPSTASATILSHFHQSMASLRVLDICASENQPDGYVGYYLPTKRLDFNLLPIGGSSLEELALAGVSYTSERMFRPLDPLLDTGVLWTEDPAIQLSNVSILHLTDCQLGCNGAEFRPILGYMPGIREVHLKRVQLSLSGPRPEAKEEEGLRMEHLEKWRAEALQDGFRDFLPESSTLPNLLHLDCVPTFPPRDLIHFYRSPLLIEALPKLRSLNLGKSTIPDDIIDVLREMTSLEFLDLSRCSLSAKFLENLAGGAKTIPRLLPNLVALSLAGNLELRAPVLRDLVNSRLPESDRIPIPLAIAVPIKRKNPFGPTRSSSSLSATPPTQPSLVPPPTTLVHTPPEVARLRWLNVDLCESVDIALYPSLERKLGFLSRSMGAPDEDRIRGRGRWDWTLDLAAHCRWKLKAGGGSLGTEEKCEIRPDGKGGYHVYHACCQAQFIEEEKGWEWTSQIERSQQSATQAKRGKKIVGRSGSQSGGRRGRIDALQER